MCKGWIKLHREITESDLWNDVTTFRMFSFLLLKVSHQEGIKINGIELQRGQWIRSYRKLAEDLAYKEGRGLKKYSLSTIKKSVAKLVKSERIEIQETELGTLFTIINYAKYQDKTDDEKESANGTANEVRTNSERSANKNKNLKNAKNAEEKNNIHLQIENLRKRYSNEQLKVIDDYLEMIRHTRASGNIANSVILKMYQEWDKHPDVCVQYGLATHVNNVAYHSKKENYTFGIIRNTTSDEAYGKLSKQKDLPKEEIKIDNEKLIKSLRRQKRNIEVELEDGIESFKMFGNEASFYKYQEELREINERLRSLEKEN